MFVSESHAIELNTIEHFAVGEIRRLHDEIIAAEHANDERARRAGELLLSLKQEAGHGNFQAFVNQHLPFNESKARVYIGAATIA